MSLSLRIRRTLILLAAAIIYSVSGAQAAVPGVSPHRILFGQSAAFTGPARALGEEMRLGIEAAFRASNVRGGVFGRRLELTSLDDAYEPEAAILNTRRLIEQSKVFALIGAVGTPTSRSATPVAAKAGVPYIAPFTGAAFLRNPKWKNIINLRASYFQETEEMVNRLINDLGVKKIAVLYQDDSFGLAGYRGVRRALERRNLKPAVTGVYPRNTTAVKTALLDIRRANPGAVVLVGAYKPVASFIAWARHMGFNPIFVTLSFVGSNALVHELGPAGVGIYVTQVVPFPTTKNLKVAADYRRDLEAHKPGAVPSFVSLEGYMAGRLTIRALELCGREPDRACLLEGLRRAATIDLGGFKLRYGKDDNQGSDAVFLTVIGEGGRYVSTEKILRPEKR